jgi:hypothetical protein
VDRRPEGGWFDVATDRRPGRGVDRDGAGRPGPGHPRSQAPAGLPVEPGIVFDDDADLQPAIDHDQESGQDVDLDGPQDGAVAAGLVVLDAPVPRTADRVADLGRLLGLDRASELKTLCRKLSELAGHGRGAALQAALCRHHATRPDAVGFRHLGGHVRVYTGTRALPKTHIARTRIRRPPTEETWVGDADGDPVMVITAIPSQSLAAELARLLLDLRAIIGPDRACTVVFDRGGYSPAVFVEIISAGFDVLTYLKGAWPARPPRRSARCNSPSPPAPPTPMSSPNASSTGPSGHGPKPAGRWRNRLPR